MNWCRIVTYIIIAYIFVTFVASIWFVRKSYKFKKTEVEEIAFANSGGYFSPTELRQNYAKKYDGIFTEKHLPTLAVITGGLHGSISLLYGAVSEFLALYHAPIQTSGNTGRHLMNVSITVLTGQVKVWYERETRARVYPAGTKYFLRIGQKAFVEMQEDTHLLLYGRGLIPMTMGYWVSDSLLSSCDLASVIQIIFYYLKAVHMSLALEDFFVSLWTSAWAIAANGLAQLPNFWEYFIDALSSVTNRLHEFFSNVLESGKSLMD